MNAIKTVSSTFGNQAGMTIKDKIFSISVNFFLFFIRRIDPTALGAAISFGFKFWTLYKKR